MQFSFKTFLLVVLVASLINSSFASLVSASDFMPADCMMAMMGDSDDELDMSDCNCSMDGMQCQRCDADFLSSTIAVLESKRLQLNTLSNNGIQITPHYFLASISLARPSPPPII